MGGAPQRTRASEPSWWRTATFTDVKRRRTFPQTGKMYDARSTGNPQSGRSEPVGPTSRYRALGPRGGPGGVLRVIGVHEEPHVGPSAVPDERAKPRRKPQVAHVLHLTDL